MNSPQPAPATTFISRQLARLPKPLADAMSCSLSLLTGLAIAFVLHYVLYRIGLPSKPFIYVAF